MKIKIIPMGSPRGSDLILRIYCKEITKEGGSFGNAFARHSSYHDYPKLLNKTQTVRDGEMTYQLRALDALPEEPGFNSSTHVADHSRRNYSSGDRAPVPSFGVPQH